MKINKKANEMIQKLLKEHPNTKLTIGYLNKGETAVKLFNDTGEIPYESFAYEIASISKVFTTSLLAKYLQEGKMDLEDSVAKYIPELNKDKYYPTLKRLATHTAGYTTEALTVGEIIKITLKYSFLKQRKNPADWWESMFMDYDKMIWFANKHNLKDKDYDWSYTDYSIALLGEAVCQVAKKPFDELMTEFLEDDLGLKQTKTQTKRADMLSGYLLNKNVGTMKAYRNGDYTAPAGGLTSTAADLLKFAKMNIEESPSYLGLCHNVYSVKAKGYDMGLGWWNWNEQPHATHWHGGGSAGFSSSLAFIKELEKATVILTNVGLYSPTDLSNAIFESNEKD